MPIHNCEDYDMFHLFRVMWYFIWGVRGPAKIFEAQANLNCTMVLHAGQQMRLWYRLALKAKRSADSQKPCSQIFLIGIEHS